MSPGEPIGSLADPDRHLVALTGLRGVAAAWVVLFHSSVAIETWLPRTTAVHAVTSMGYLGVDLFFALSGFVLCHRYLDGMGPRLRAGLVRDFVLLRLARLYPVHLAVTALFGLYVALLASTGSDRQWDPLFGAGDLLQHLTLVQAWLNQPLTWNVPSWSVSLEWLAYLAFPAAVVIVKRIADSPHPVRGALLLLAFAHAPLTAQAVGAIRLPMVSFIGNQGPSGAMGVNLLRLVAGFGGGCAAFVLARTWQEGRPHSSRRPPAWLSGAAYSLTVVTVIYGGVHGYTEQTDAGWLVSPLLVLSVALIGLAGPLTTWLESPVMVHAGLMSYSLYMTHWLTLSVLGLVPGVRIEAGVAHRLGIAAAGPFARAGFSAATLVACFAAAHVCWRLVEEPARRALRARLMGGAAAVPIEERPNG